jgi:predicted small secreted protein
MKRELLCCIALLVALGATGCNTVRGVGRDIESGGRAIQRASHANATHSSSSSRAPRSSRAQGDYARKERAYGKI